MDIQTIDKLLNDPSQIDGSTAERIKSLKCPTLKKTNFGMKWVLERVSKENHVTTNNEQPLQMPWSNPGQFILCTLE
jgi:hypothetical protein